MAYRLFSGETAGDSWRFCGLTPCLAKVGESHSRKGGDDCCCSLKLEMCGDRVRDNDAGDACGEGGIEPIERILQNDGISGILIERFGGR